VTFVDASLVASRLLGDAIYANLFLLGIAHQLGKVPVSAEALNAAIALNGVEIEANQKAFIMGCRFAVWPQKVLALLEPSDHSLQKNEPAETIGLDELVDERARRLVAYQSESLAKAYRHQVDTIRQLDPQALSAGSISHVVAKQLYRLMAIKDEYEVARLFSSDAFRAQLDAQFEPGYRPAIPSGTAHSQPHRSCDGPQQEKSLRAWIFFSSACCITATSQHTAGRLRAHR
jgi:indolepyruvate ferredoxin oxidoreductase